MTSTSSIRSTLAVSAQKVSRYEPIMVRPSSAYKGSSSVPNRLRSSVRAIASAGVLGTDPRISDLSTYPISPLVPKAMIRSGSSAGGARLELWRPSHYHVNVLVQRLNLHTELAPARTSRQGPARPSPARLPDPTLGIRDRLVQGDDQVPPGEFVEPFFDRPAVRTPRCPCRSRPRRSPGTAPP